MGSWPGLSVRFTALKEAWLGKPKKLSFLDLGLAAISLRQSFAFRIQASATRCPKVERL